MLVLDRVSKSSISCFHFDGMFGGAGTGTGEVEVVQILVEVRVVEVEVQERKEKKVLISKNVRSCPITA